MAWMACVIMDNMRRWRRNWVTSSKWVSCVTRLTRAEWSVVHHLAIGGAAASTRTRIQALVTDAGLVKIALRGYCTFRSTTRRSANEFWQARAGGHTILFAALRVRTTRRGLTGVDIFPNGFRFDATIPIWVTHIATEAVTSGQVIAHKAFGILAAASGTGITAFLIDTGQLRGAIRVKYTFRTTSFIRIAEILW